jgi:hypothetical protein
VHLLEGGLHVGEADLLGDERVEVEAALLVEVNEHREVPAGQAVAVPARLQRSPAPEHVEQREVGHLHVGGRHADQHDRTGEVASVERLLPGLRATDRVDDDVSAEAPGERLDGLDRVVVAAVHGVGGTQACRPLELLVVEVDRDDGPGTGEAGAGHRGRSHAAAADHRDALAAPDVAGVDGGAQPGHHATAEETDSSRTCGRVDLGALTGVHQRLVRERADPQCRGQRRPGSLPFGERHLLGRVVGGEAVPRLAA